MVSAQRSDPHDWCEGHRVRAWEFASAVRQVLLLVVRSRQRYVYRVGVAALLPRPRLVHWLPRVDGVAYPAIDLHAPTIGDTPDQRHCSHSIGGTDLVNPGCKARPHVSQRPGKATWMQPATQETSQK